MKKVLFSLFALVALFVVSSCSSSETMNKLDGTWETSTVEDGMPVMMTWTFNSADETAKLRAVSSVDGMEVSVLEVNASFTADEKTIIMNFDKGEPKFLVPEATVQAFGLSQADVNEIVNGMKEDAGDTYEGTSKTAIETLTDDELVINEDGRIVFHKVK